MQRNERFLARVWHVLGFRVTSVSGAGVNLSFRHWSDRTLPSTQIRNPGPRLHSPVPADREELPDHKTQLAAVELYLTHNINLPVQSTENLNLSRARNCRLDLIAAGRAKKNGIIRLNETSAVKP